MKVQLLTPTPISVNGIKVTHHDVGEVLDLPEGLALSMINAKQADAYRDELPTETQEEAAHTPKLVEEAGTPKKRYRNDPK